MSLPIWLDNLSSGEYFLSILVYETAGNKISINIQINGTKLFDYESDNKGEFVKVTVLSGEKRNISRYDASEMWNGLNNNVSEDIDRLFTKLESIQDKALSKETTTLKWGN